MRALIGRKRARVGLQGFFPVLFGGHVSKAEHGARLAEEFDVIGHRLGDVVGLPDPEIGEHLRLGPPVYGFRRLVVGPGRRGGGNP